MDVILGIDPGVDGSMVAMYKGTHRGREIVKYQCWNYKDHEIFGLADVVKKLKKKFTMQAYIEDVRGAFTPAKSKKLGETVGEYKMAMVMMAIPFSTVNPTTWQQTLGLGAKAAYHIRKKKQRNMAKELFPGKEITHSNADAILIAYYGMKINGQI